ncbi:MAG: molybdopterin-dependent oxidoreductase [Actinobacteria bacterium]|nr:molybdopterin-dependent oxidoreductase [Actinomycetota bacterium]
MTRTESALAGVAAAGLGIAAGQLLGTLVDPASAPLVAVGSALIDLAPTPVKEWAVSTVGTADKPLLIAGIAVVAGLVAALAGIAARKRRWVGDLACAVFGLAGVVAALTRASAGPLDAVPSLLAAAVAAVVLRLLLGRLERRDQTAERPQARTKAGLDRRVLLAGGAGVLATAATATLPGVSRPQPTESAVTLPAPAETASALPTGLDATVAGISPLRTPVADFYRIDTALFVPQLGTADWTLSVNGLVARPFELSWTELLALPMIERDITLTCVSNEIGGPYCGSTRWQGVRVADLLERAQPAAGADMVLSTSSDGFTASTPLAVLLDGRDAMVAVAMDGRPLPREHGFPARLLTPGLYGYVGATKWLTSLRVTTFAADQAYWTVRGWGERGPVKTATRIDTPSGRAAAGDTVVAGVAWATHRGISAVEVQVDGGDWQQATLGPDVGLDYWRQWYLPWTATPGSHRLAARARDGDGVVQTAQVQGVLPDGPTGYHVVTVQVG